MRSPEQPPARLNLEAGVGVVLDLRADAARSRSGTSVISSCAKRLNRLSVRVWGRERAGRHGGDAARRDAVARPERQLVSRPLVLRLLVVDVEGVARLADRHFIPIRAIVVRLQLEVGAWTDRA